MPQLRISALSILIATLTVAPGLAEGRLNQPQAADAMRPIAERIGAARELLHSVAEETKTPVAGYQKRLAQWYNWGDWPNLWRDWRDWWNW
jgi:hypothetical protein